ncbi:hypothetical protein EON65_47610 [archaeon]|nr:MAG: hypothetical protein EON65_47610 [archaeon]
MTFTSMFHALQVAALCATGFLLGPRSQCRQMFHPTRRYTTSFYLIMMIIVFAVAVAVGICFYCVAQIHQNILTNVHNPISIPVPIPMPIPTPIPTSTLYIS